MEFADGCIGTIATSFATRFGTYDGKQPITIYGEEGTLKVPDPNGFDGPVHIRRKSDPDWIELPHTFVKGYGRSVGLADMAYAIRFGAKDARQRRTSLRRPRPNAGISRFHPIRAKPSSQKQNTSVRRRCQQICHLERSTPDF
jgi:predicted dehydrogenase